MKPRPVDCSDFALNRAQARHEHRQFSILRHFEARFGLVYRIITAYITDDWRKREQLHEKHANKEPLNNAGPAVADPELLLHRADELRRT